MSHEAVAAVTALIELGMIAQEDIVKCLKKALSEPEPQRKPLTDEQIAAIGKELGLKCRLGGNPNIDFDYARAIEAAHGITEE